MIESFPCEILHPIDAPAGIADPNLSTPMTVHAYEIIQLPLTRPFRDMSTRELRAYRDWFLAQIPVRIEELERTVRASRNYRGWRANRSARSLLPLGEWFARQVSTRKLTADELQAEKARLTFEIPDYPDWDLTARTLSLCFDIGMYLALVLQKKHPNLFWTQSIRAKTYVDHGQPELAGFTTQPVNPVRLVTVIAYGVARKTSTGRRLHEVFKIWSDQA